MVKNPPSNAGDIGLIPARGTKIPHPAGQLRLLSATKTECSQNKNKVKNLKTLQIYSLIVLEVQIGVSSSSGEICFSATFSFYELPVSLGPWPLPHVLPRPFFSYHISYFPSPSCLLIRTLLVISMVGLPF